MLLDSALQMFPSSLVSFTMDITQLTEHGLISVQNVLHRATLERLHINCVPFMPSRGPSIAQLLKAINWPTIKSLSLTGRNIDDWLELWSSGGGLQGLVSTWIGFSSFGPSLLSLDVVAFGESKVVLSHTSALAIHHLIYSFCLADLRLENILLKNKQEWDLVLGGIHDSNLKNLILRNCNVPGAMRHRAILGRPLRRLKKLVSGSQRKVLSRSNINSK